MKVRTSRVLKKFNTWVVTVYGIESTTRYYPIEAKRVWELDWLNHLGAKAGNWDISNFEDALLHARSLWPRKTRTSLPVTSHASASEVQNEGGKS